MFDAIIRGSLRHPWLVVLASAVLLVAGLFETSRIPLDVLPELTRRLDVALDEVAASLPKGMELYRKGFRQADFIRVALENVLGVLRDGAILVTVVLVLFLMSWRTTLISLLALPLSLLAASWCCARAGRPSTP